ncbi:MAG TPA: potassium-transporting ATPase subunit KdpC [Steroidobacteraceae bacterium]|jgi:K+-transporting ATPase ATPase C chain|nr:potassium-transporting ATPase subunit KdpC [Steroidobacteraceae bacterium]
MRSLIRPALVLFLFFTVLTGLVYPLVITGIAQAAFGPAASGSIIFRGDKPIGSSLIGQNFSDAKYFWGRPSATSPQPYAGTASTGSNLGPLNPALIDGIKGHIQALQAADPGNRAPIPVDLVTASASGLDPQESIAAALYQAPRVARARGMPLSVLRTVIEAHSQARWLGVFGEPRVNVLALNLALDDLAAGAGSR